jgi:hypothetical protein
MATIGTTRRFASPLAGHTGSISFLNNPKQRSYPLVAWMVLIGIFCPPIPISLGDTSVTPGRMIVIMLIVPAVAVLLRKGRRSVPSDYFVVATASWMIASSALNDGFRPYVVAEALELAGAYFIGRAFFWGRPALETFIKVFKVITIAVILLALLDTLSGRNVTLQSMGIEGEIPLTDTGRYRFGLVRASSTLLGGEQYGTFCAAALAILLYSGRNHIRYAVLTIFGCLLSLSSGPFLGMAIVIATSSYDRVLKRHSWRWKALVGTIIGAIVVLNLVSNSPVSWLIRHLTLDPQTGFFRVVQWDHVLPLIGLSPILGYGFSPFYTLVDPQWRIYIGTSLDCVWLVEALRYGIPGVAFLLLSIFSSVIKKTSDLNVDPYMNNLRTGFSIAIMTFVLVGLTVHYWNNVWLFFHLCIGIRATFAESSRSSPRNVPAGVKKGGAALLSQ